jgi:regulator of cell morphogenesis and NO signaling
MCHRRYQFLRSSEAHRDAWVQCPPWRGPEGDIMSAALTLEPCFASRTLADIAASVPGATSVFRLHKLDFCCGGNVSLAEAAAAKGLPLPTLEAELSAVAVLARPQSLPDSSSDLIDLIETRYHAAHRREFPELIRLARRVEAVHRNKPSVPRGLADLLERMSEDLGAHMQQEEQVVFPAMRRGDHAPLDQSISVLLAEHDDHGAHLRELDRLTTDFTAPEEACSTWRALYVGARKLSDDLMEHIHIENFLLFPRFAG